MLKNFNVAKLMAISKEWRKGDMHRIYFNNLSSLYGLKTDHYNSGNIAGATLNGQRISNGEAYKIASRLMCSKFWYDVKDGKFYMQGHTEYFQDLITAIKERIAIKKEED